MTINDLTAPLEEFAPPVWQADYDNSGLIVGRRDTEISAALICLDVTEDVLNEAQSLGCQLIISHHPIIFHPLRRFDGEGHVERIVERAIRYGIAIYACHTNLDSAPDGMSFALAKILGIGHLNLLEGDENSHGFGVIGTLSEPRKAVDFLRDVQKKLNVKAVRHSELTDAKIQRIALCTGSGGSLIRTAKRAGAELFLAADFKYNDFSEGETGARNPFAIADIGHYESEICAIELIHTIISKKIVNFALHKTTRAKNPVNYLI